MCRAAYRELLARGALSATALGARERASLGGSRALAAVFSELFAVARAERRALTVDDWLHAAISSAWSARGGSQSLPSRGSRPASDW